MILKFLAILCILIACVVIFGFLKMPSVLKITRAQKIEASPEALFSFINNPIQIQRWNPFTAGDPEAIIQFSGPTEGVDASWSWEGKKAGAGKATILKSEPNQRVEVRLDFKRPFQVTNIGEYRLMPEGNVTEVIWTIDESATIPRFLSSFINLEKMIGTEFEKGLLQLKLLVEKK